MAGINRLKQEEYSLLDCSSAPLLERMRAALAQAVGRPMEDGDPEMIAAASILPFFSQGLAAADIAAKSMMLQFATGAALERLSELYDVPRLPATPARVTVSVSAAGSLPPGLLISIKAVLEGHEFTGALRWKASASDMFLTLTCSDLGRVGNGLSSMDEWSAAPSGLVASVTRLGLSAGGQEAEDDEALAQRIADTLTARVAPGTAEWYRAAMLEVDGVIDAAAYPNIQGGVNLVHVGDADLDSWTARFYHAQDMLLGDVTTRVEAQVLGRTITFSCALPSGIVQLEAAQAFEARLRAAFKPYADAHEEKLIVDFNPVEGMRILQEEGATSIYCDTEPFRLGYSITGDGVYLAQGSFVLEVDLGLLG